MTKSKRCAEGGHVTSNDVLDGAHDALNKMQRAHRRGTGTHLTREEVQSLALTIIGDLWGQPDPRKPSNAEGKLPSVSAASGT